MTDSPQSGHRFIGRALGTGGSGRWPKRTGGQEDKRTGGQGQARPGGQEDRARPGGQETWARPGEHGFPHKPPEDTHIADTFKDFFSFFLSFTESAPRPIQL